jgi:mannose-6-phosphate isomerase-like protein (cupin superfamily)
MATSAACAKAFRISPNDSNYFVMLFEPKHDEVENVYVVEIFTEHGRTPPNIHHLAHEFFYVLAGEGIAECDGAKIAVKPGSALLLRPGHEHLVVNTGSGKLYTLTIMTPNEGFAELILNGTPVELDEEDIRVLERLPTRAAKP